MAQYFYIKKGFNMGTRALRISELKLEKDIKEFAILFEEMNGKIASLKDGIGKDSAEEAAGKISECMKFYEKNFYPRIHDMRYYMDFVSCLSSMVKHRARWIRVKAFVCGTIFGSWFIIIWQWGAFF